MKISYCYIVLSMVVLAFACEKKEKEPLNSLSIIDLNSPEQYADAHIKGAINSNLDELEERTKEWDKNKPIVVYCSNYMCTASGSGAELLQSLGFKKVFAYEGGISQWYQLSKSDPRYVLVGPAQMDYLNIVIEKPLNDNKNFQEISAEDLQKMMKSDNIL